MFPMELSWFVVCPIKRINEETTADFNRVAVKDVASSKLASHHFAMEYSVKDISLEEMFHTMH